MPSISFGHTEIEYNVEYKHNKKDISISVEWMEGVLVKAPEGIKNEQLQQIIRKKVPWIVEKLKKIDEIAQPGQAKEYVSGEKFPYLGRNYRLKVHKQDNDVIMPSLRFYQGKFSLEVHSLTLSR
jgi:predicted metal-dependent hydrolase